MIDDVGGTVEKRPRREKFRHAGSVFGASLDLLQSGAATPRAHDVGGSTGGASWRRTGATVAPLTGRQRTAQESLNVPGVSVILWLMPTLQAHFSRVHTHYVDLVDGGDFEELERELRYRMWALAASHVEPPPSIMRRAEAVMLELEAAVVTRHRSGALGTLERFRVWIHRITV